MIDKIKLLVNPTYLAKLGILKINLQNDQVFWDSITRSIFEVTDCFELNGSNRFDLFMERQNRDNL